MRTNTPVKTPIKMPKAVLSKSKDQAYTQLERTVATCLLFETTFYEGGNSVAKRIQDLCVKVSNEEGLEPIVDLAITARNDLKLRHAPLFLARQIARINSSNPRFKGEKHTETVLREVIQRPDELAEFLSLYWKDNGTAKDKHGVTVPRKTLSSQVKRGLGDAFKKFNEYSLAKYNRDNAIKLRDVLFLTHAKPKNAEQDALWKRLINNELKVPDTWEVALSAGKDKQGTWERLLSENKLGYMALLKNLRNMTQVNVNSDLIRQALLAGAGNNKALPFRFINAAKFAPQFSQELSEAMCQSIKHLKFGGSTAIVIDVSPSMASMVAQKSKTSRYAAASALAILFRETTPNCRIFAFSNKMWELPNFRGLSIMEKIEWCVRQSSGTLLKKALTEVYTIWKDVERVVVITDEQSQDGIFPAWAPRSYLINVAPYEDALGNKVQDRIGTIDMENGWIRINGWSNRVLDWLSYEETGKILEADNEDEQTEDD